MSWCFLLSVCCYDFYVLAGLKRCSILDQMLVELEVVTDPERVGFYSGIIVSDIAPKLLSIVLTSHPRNPFSFSQTLSPVRAGLTMFLLSD